MSETKKPSSSARGPRKPRQTAPKELEEAIPPAMEDVPFRSERKLVEPESEVDIYTLQLFFDPEEAVFRAGFVEFPELRVADESRKEAIYAAEDKLHSHLAALRQSGKPVPEPIRTREYPARLDIAISQTLSRKLETRRSQERVPLEQMVAEMLTSACDRRGDNPSNENRGAGGGNRDRRPSQKGGRGQQRGGGGHRRGGYNDTMDNRENFMEYVRNLEKGGGPGFKKR